MFRLILSGRQRKQDIIKEKDTTPDDAEMEKHHPTMKKLKKTKKTLETTVIETHNRHAIPNRSTVIASQQKQPFYN